MVLFAVSRDWHHAGKDRSLLCTECRLFFKKYGEDRPLDGDKDTSSYLFKPVKEEEDTVNGKHNMRTRRGNSAVSFHHSLVGMEGRWCGFEGGVRSVLLWSFCWWRTACTWLCCRMAEVAGVAEGFSPASAVPVWPDTIRPRPFLLGSAGENWP